MLCCAAQVMDAAQVLCLCCAVLVLCCAVLCCAVLCCAVLCCAVLLLLLLLLLTLQPVLWKSTGYMRMHLSRC